MLLVEIWSHFENCLLLLSCESWNTSCSACSCVLAILGARRPAVSATPAKPFENTRKTFPRHPQKPSKTTAEPLPDTRSNLKHPQNFSKTPAPVARQATCCVCDEGYVPTMGSTANGCQLQTCDDIDGSAGGRGLLFYVFECIELLLCDYCVDYL